MMDANYLPQRVRNSLHDVVDEFVEKTNIESVHNSLYVTFFDYLKSAPKTDTFVFKQSSNDIYILLDFLKKLEKAQLQNKLDNTI